MPRYRPTSVPSGGAVAGCGTARGCVVAGFGTASPPWVVWVWYRQQAQHDGRP
jgi:hypothetical protein